MEYRLNRMPAEDRSAAADADLTRALLIGRAGESLAAGDPADAGYFLSLLPGHNRPGQRDLLMSFGLAVLAAERARRAWAG